MREKMEMKIQVGRQFVPVQDDVQVESGDVVSDNNVRIEFPYFGEEEAQQGPLGLHLVDLGGLGLHDLLKVERPHLVRGPGHGAKMGGEGGPWSRPVQVEVGVDQT